MLQKYNFFFNLTRILQSKYHFFVKKGVNMVWSVFRLEVIGERLEVKGKR